jgi:excisionase family DNA binding protein
MRQDYWKIPDLAKHWDVSNGYVYRLVASGELRHMKMGKSKQSPVRIPNEAVVRYE